MTIQNSTYFKFNDKWSSDFGIMLGHVGGSGLYKESFLPSRDIKEVYVNHRKRPYYMQLVDKPITITAQICFEDEFDTSLLDQVKSWLYTEDPKELIFDGDQDRLFYAFVEADTDLNHNGTNGYIDLTFRTDAPYSYSRSTTKVFDLSNNIQSGTIIDFTSKGTLPLYPEIEIHKIGAGDVSIFNLSNGGTETKVTNLRDDETVYLNCDPDNEEVISSLESSGVYRWDDFNNNFIELLYGVNRLQVIGNCIVTMRYQFRYL